MAIVASVLALGDLLVMTLEVPTGWLADRFGDRRSMVAGSCVQVAGMIACWLCPGTYSLIAGSALIALGDALRSGADEALLYRSCAAAGCPQQFQRIESATRSAATVILVLLTAGGGAIVHAWGWHAAWALDTLLCTSGAVIAWAMHAPPAQPAAPSHTPAGRSLVSRQLLAIVLPAALVAAAASAASFIVQTAADTAVGTVGALTAALVAAEAAGLAAGGHITAVSARSQGVIAAGSLLALAAATQASSVAAAAALALAFTAGALDPWRAAAVQRLAADHLRATGASLTSACDMACSTLLLPLAGLVQGWRRRR